jgi:hypothetical protein
MTLPRLLLICAAVSWAAGPARPSLAEEQTKPTLSPNECNAIYALHKEKDGGFVVSKVIEKGPALADYAVFNPGNCLLVLLDDLTQATIKTPVGVLERKRVYHIKSRTQAEDVTEAFHFPYKDAAGFCYQVPANADASAEPRKSGFLLYNWESEKFKYCRRSEDGVLIINPKEKEACAGSSGTITHFKSCELGVRF